MAIAVIINTILLAMDHHGQSEQFEQILELGNLILTGIFTLEVHVLQVHVYGKAFPPPEVVHSRICKSQKRKSHRNCSCCAIGVSQSRTMKIGRCCPPLMVGNRNTAPEVSPDAMHPAVSRHLPVVSLVDCALCAIGQAIPDASVLRLSIDGPESLNVENPSVHTVQ